MIALAVYAIGLVPLVWIASPGLGPRWLVLVFAGAILALGIFQTGILSRGSLTDTSVGHLLPDQSLRARCVEVIDVARKAGVVLDASQPGKLVVQNSIWQQAPAEVRDAISACAAQVAPPPGGAQQTNAATDPTGTPEPAGVQIILR